VSSSSPPLESRGFSRVLVVGFMPGRSTILCKSDPVSSSNFPTRCGAPSVGGNVDWSC
jgi:hypothetical protein